MSGSQELSDRKKLILKAVIDAHIRNGEPVGSKSLTQNQQIACSSATIRSEMAELESMGYLEQPHTSAGRVPSVAGYRFYVDWLIERYKFTASEIERLRRAISEKQEKMRGILEAGAKLASAMTNYTALAVRNKPPNTGASFFELVRLDPRNLLLVIMIPDGTVKTRHLRCSVDVSPEGAAALAALLNARIIGLKAEDISLRLMMEIEEVMGEYGFLVSPVMKAVCEELSSSEGSEFSVEGLNRLLSYPEYSDIGRFKELIATLEEKDDMARLIDAGEADDGRIHVYIGSENPEKFMEGSTLIFKALKNSGRTVGAIGIIGPVRMNYSRVISVLDNLTGQIADMLEQPGALSPGGDGG